MEGIYVRLIIVFYDVYVRQMCIRDRHLCAGEKENMQADTGGCILKIINMLIPR